VADNTNGSEPEKFLARLRELDTLREDLIRRQAAMGERHAAAQRDLIRIVEEMKQLGTSPQTIQADLAKSVEDVKKRTSEYEDSLVQLKNELDKAEEASQNPSRWFEDMAVRARSSVNQGGDLS
jgi:chromosome segregation ATPase